MLYILIPTTDQTLSDKVHRELFMLLLPLDTCLNINCDIC